MKLLISGILICCSLTVVGQCESAPRIPETVILNHAEDYDQYQKDVRKCLSWLLRTPLNECKSKRDELNAFVLLWLAGSPDVIIKIDKSSLPFIKEHESLVYTFIHGMAFYQMDHPKEQDAIVLQSKGVTAVGEAIMRSEGITKDKILKGIVKATKKGREEEWVMENLSSKMN